MDTLASRSSLTRRLIVLYMCALCSIAVLAILCQVVIQVAIQQQDSDAFVINTAGRQRMLSQRIAKNALILVKTTDPTVRTVRTEELQQTVTLWEQAQQGLQNGNAKLDLPPATSLDVKRLFSTIDPNYQTMLGAAKNILKELDQDVASSAQHPNIAPFVDTILAQESPFLVGMDQIVSQYQREAEEHVSSLRRTELLLLGITLAVLLMEGSFVFRPTVRKLQETIAEREVHVRELAQTNWALVHSHQQLEQLNHQLESVHQLEGIILARASHELQTPTTSIRGQAQLALRHLAKSQQPAPELSSLRTHLEKIVAQTHRQCTLIDDLLDVSSLSSGKVPLRLATCDLGSLCREVVDDQHTLSGHPIELELPIDTVMLQADCQRLTQVIVNLVSNAVKYSSENASVRVSVSKKLPHAIFAIHNDDHLIPPEEQTHIFEPFYRTPEAQRSPTRGWGLGLSISKEIVERHRGQIWIESSQGKGTSFFVQLPLQATT